MKVTYTDFAAPNKRGTSEHLQPALAASLIAAGFAVACPLPRRGEPGWIEARLEQSRNAGPPDAHDVNPGFALVPEWGVRDKVHAEGRVLIIKKVGTDTTFFTEPQPDTPAAVVARFEQLSGIFDGAGAAALEKARTEQAKHNAKLHNARRW